MSSGNKKLVVCNPNNTMVISAHGSETTWKEEKSIRFIMKDGGKCVPRSKGTRLFDIEFQQASDKGSMLQETQEVERKYVVMMNKTDELKLSLKVETPEIKEINDDDEMEYNKNGLTAAMLQKFSHKKLTDLFQSDVVESSNDFKIYEKLLMNKLIKICDDADDEDVKMWASTLHNKEEEHAGTKRFLQKVGCPSLNYMIMQLDRCGMPAEKTGKRRPYKRKGEANDDKGAAKVPKKRGPYKKKNKKESSDSGTEKGKEEQGKKKASRKTDGQSSAEQVGEPSKEKAADVNEKDTSNKQPQMNDDSVKVPKNSSDVGSDDDDEHVMTPGRNNKDKQDDVVKKEETGGNYDSPSGSGSKQVKSDDEKMHDVFRSRPDSDNSEDSSDSEDEDSD